MSENRSETVFMTVTPTLKRRLAAYAKRNRWTLSTAASTLVERGLDFTDRQAELSGKAATRPDIAELARQFDIDDQEGNRG
jgi:hypothetical protein